MALFAWTGTASAQSSTDSSTSYAAPSAGGADALAGADLSVEARLTKDGGIITKGLVWRVFDTVKDENGNLALIATAKGGSASFQIAPGSYIVNASYGRAGATKRVQLSRDGLTENFVLEAGGLKLNAIASNGSDLKARHLKFTVYEARRDAKGNRKLIARDVPSDRILRLNSGTYHVVSSYGTINASVRADLRVQAGKLTEAVLQHRAAQVFLKLVSERGGEAIADTAWSVFTEQGDVVQESSSTFPTLILAEGSYSAIARHRGNVFTHDFKVESGVNQDVDVLAQNPQK